MQLYTLILLELNIFLKKYETKSKIKAITHNIFRIQDNESAMCGFYCIAFMELQENFCHIIRICFLELTVKRMTK